MLDQVSLQIGAGEFVGIVGCTGCGKTTLLKAMAGLLEVQSGEILLDGENIFSRRFDRAVLRRKVGMVFQYPEYQLFAQTVEKDVGFGLKYSRLSREEKQERVRWALEQMGFSYEEIKDQSPLSLSGGEKRRVAIAGVLATKPELLMLDEPLAGLDPMAREMFLEFLEGLTGQGVSVVMVSHNVDALAQHAARIIGMKQGKIVMDGSCQEVLGDSRALRTMDCSAAKQRRPRSFCWQTVCCRRGRQSGEGLHLRFRKRWKTFPWKKRGFCRAAGFPLLMRRCGTRLSVR